MAHGAFNFNKIYFAIITYEWNMGEELAKITAKSKRNKTIFKDRYFRFQT